MPILYGAVIGAAALLVIPKTKGSDFSSDLKHLESKLR
jgi:hypothetical protein